MECGVLLARKGQDSVRWLERSAADLSREPHRSLASMDMDHDETQSDEASSHATQTRRSRVCEVKGCSKKPQSRGLCVGHGGGRRCDVEGCPRKAQSRGLCIAHGGGKRCQYPDCSNSAKGGGYCKSHGGGKRCQVPGCTKSAASKGLCITHGGGRRCEVPGCIRSAQNQGLCITHGGGRQCVIKDCQSKARSRGLCILHGGGKRCKIPKCSNSAQSGGLCITHGGGKRCSVQGCVNSAKSGGICITHGGGSRCRIPDCVRTAHTHQLCTVHLEESAMAEARRYIASSAGPGVASVPTAMDIKPGAILGGTRYIQFPSSVEATQYLPSTTDGWSRHMGNPAGGFHQARPTAELQLYPRMMSSLVDTGPPPARASIPPTSNPAPAMRIQGYSYGSLPMMTSPVGVQDKDKLLDIGLLQSPPKSIVSSGMKGWVKEKLRSEDGLPGFAVASNGSSSAVALLNPEKDRALSNDSTDKSSSSPKAMSIKNLLNS